MAQNSPFISQPPVPASVARFGLQVNDLTIPALDAVRAAGATMVRTQMSWSAVEPYGSLAYALPAGGEAWLAHCAQIGLAPILVAAYGPPWTLLGSLTLTAGISIGDTVVHVSGAILSTINPPYCHVTGGVNGIVGFGTGKWAYYGALIDSVNPGAGTITLATPAVEAIANGSTLTVNNLKYASLATQDPTNVGAVAFAAYATFLAQRIAANNCPTGYVCLWNEPPWANDSWHARGYFYTTPPMGVTAGVVGIPALVQACLPATLPAGVRFVNDGTDKTGFASMSTLSPLPTAARIKASVAFESFHPYSDSPEGYGWDRNNPISTLFGGPGAYENLVTGDTGNFGWLDRQDDLLAGAVGGRPKIIATETGAAYGDDTRQAVWLLRRVASLWGMNALVNVYDLRDGGTYDVTTGAGSTYTPRLSYTALKRLTGIVAKLGPFGTTPTPIPTVLSTASPWQTMSTGIYGAGGLLLVWQRTIGSPWVSLSAPGTWPVEIQVPYGYAIAEAIDLLTGNPVALASTTGAVSVPVGESVIAIRTTRAPGPLNLLTLGRLTLPTVKDDFKEGVGEPLDTTGAGVALGQRRPKLFGLTLPLKAQPDGSNTDFVAAGLRMRRQLRSMIQNPTLRGQGIFLAFTPDGEIDGWVMVGNGQIAYDQGNVGFGNFTLTLDEIYQVATLSTHQPGLRLLSTDRRLQTTARDFKGELFLIDFAGLSTIALHGLPGVGPGLTRVEFASGTYRVGGSWAGPDGPGYLSVNAIDSDVALLEQAETARLLGQVIAYDRRGNLTAPSAGPDPLWEEVYGPKYPWNWLTPGQPADAPVLANDRCRVRFDGVSMILRVDSWVSNAWVEQCQIVVQRYNPTVPALYTDDTFQSARLVEYTGERAVMLIVLSSSSDVASREEVYVSLQRGWQGPRIEVYPSPTSGAVVCGAALEIVSATVDTNDAALKIDAGNAGKVAATDGSGSAFFPGGNLGAATFTGENEVIMHREGQATGIASAVLQATVNCQATAASAGFGGARNAILLLLTAGGYLTTQLGFPAQQSDQSLEAEAIRFASGTTTQVADATASGGQCVKDTQTAATANTLVKSPANLLLAGKYRVALRVKVDGGATGSFAASTNSGVSTLTPTSTSTTWVWVDCGDLLINATLSSFGAQGWRSAGAGSVYIDKVKLFKVEDRVTGGPLWDGARDLGQAFLTDARAIPVQVER